MDGEDLKLIRGVLGYTRQEMAQKIGASASHIAHMEEGGRDVSLLYHGRILQVLRSNEFTKRAARLRDIISELEHLQNRGDIKI